MVLLNNEICLCNSATYALTLMLLILLLWCHPIGLSFAKKFFYGGSVCLTFGYPSQLVNDLYSFVD